MQYVVGIAKNIDALMPMPATQLLSTKIGKEQKLCGLRDMRKRVVFILCGNIVWYTIIRRFSLLTTAKITFTHDKGKFLFNEVSFPVFCS